MKKIGLVLSGCGFLDGSEIQESVLTLLALSRLGVEVKAFAPDDTQWEVVHHLTQKVTGEERNVLAESSRIVRGECESLIAAKSTNLSGLIIPGGFGVAKNLCNFAQANVEMKVRPDVTQLILDMHKAGKPIGAICIAPVLLGKVLGAFKPRLTLGLDESFKGLLSHWGAEFVAADVDEVVVDNINKLVTTPAFMLDRPIDRIEKGIMRLVEEIVRLA